MHICTLLDLKDHLSPSATQEDPSPGDIFEAQIKLEIDKLGGGTVVHQELEIADKMESCTKSNQNSWKEQKKGIELE